MRPLVDSFSEIISETPWSMESAKIVERTVNLPRTLELLQAVFDDGTRKPVTVSQYCNHVIRLYKGMFNSEAEISNFEWLRDATKVLAYLANTYPDKLPMQATGINPLLVVVKKEFPKDNELYQTYYRRYQEVRELMDKARPPPQVMTEREFANWKTISQINEHRVELQRRVNRSILPKTPGQLTIADRVILIRYLVLCLYTQSPSLRNDYSNLPIIQFEEMDTPSTKALMAGKGNYLLEHAKGHFRIILRDFKTSKSLGEQTIDLPTRTCNVIAETLEAFPRKFLLSCMRTPDQPMSRNYLTKFCASIFPDANVGTCLLRKICVSNAMKDAPSIAEREELAKKMLHSASIQQRTYEKKYLPDGSKIQFDDA